MADANFPDLKASVLDRLVQHQDPTAIARNMSWPDNVKDVRGTWTKLNVVIANARVYIVDQTAHQLPTIVVEETLTARNNSSNKQTGRMSFSRSVTRGKTVSISRGVTSTDAKNIRASLTIPIKTLKGQLQTSKTQSVSVNLSGRETNVDSVTETRATNLAPVVKPGTKLIA